MSSNDVCLATFVSTVDSQCLKNDICLCFVLCWWSFTFPLHFQHISYILQSIVMSSCIFPPTVSCHPDRWSFSFLTAYSLSLHISPTVASLQKIGLCHLLTSVRMIFYTSLFSIVLSRLTPALASPTSFRHRISSSFNVYLPLIFLSAPTSARSIECLSNSLRSTRHSSLRSAQQTL